MVAPRSFPALRESDVRRLVSPAIFKRGLRLWDADAVLSPAVDGDNATLFADVRDSHSTCHLMVQHLAGQEYRVRCACDDGGMCAHAVALLLAWVSAGYAFAKAVASPEPEAPDARGRQQWREYLQEANLSHLRAIARRHDMPLPSSDRAAMLEQVVETLSTDEAQRYAIASLNEPQRRALEMLYLLSDGRPDTTAEDVQDALGWSSRSEVDDVLRELAEWGLVVSVPSRWHRSNPFTIAPRAAPLVSQLDAQRCEDEQFFAQPRNVCIEPYLGGVDNLRIAAQTCTVPELLLIARHMPMRLRPPRPELAQARSNRALRGWTYDVDELVRLQVQPGWLHLAGSALSVPAPAARLDDESLARLRVLTRDDMLSDFVSHFLPAATLGPTEAGGTQNVQESFTRWLQLTNWSELWVAQQEHGLSVRRAVAGVRLTFLEWLNRLARARRFVMRVLSGLDAGRWYDFRTLLAFIHAIHADFLRDERGQTALAPSWWIEVNDAPVDLHDFDAWCASYGRFVEWVLRGPLLWFGAARLAFAADAQLLALQITPLGDALIHERQFDSDPDKDAPVKVLDDLRVVVPIGRTDLSAYRVLEQIARFDSLDDSHAGYRFDIERAHAAFESGLTLDDVLLQLDRFVRGPIPENVREQWLEWWSRYARVRTYDGLTLIEFADDYMLQELLTQTDLEQHLLFTFGARLVALRPESADSVARQLIKKGYMPRIE